MPVEVYFKTLNGASFIGLNRFVAEDAELGEERFECFLVEQVDALWQREDDVVGFDGLELIQRPCDLVEPAVPILALGQAVAVNLGSAVSAVRTAPMPALQRLVIVHGFQVNRRVAPAGNRGHSEAEMLPQNACMLPSHRSIVN